MLLRHVLGELGLFVEVVVTEGVRGEQHRATPASLDGAPGGLAEAIHLLEAFI